METLEGRRSLATEEKAGRSLEVTRGCGRREKEGPAGLETCVLESAESSTCWYLSWDSRDETWARDYHEWLKIT